MPCFFFLVSRQNHRPNKFAIIAILRLTVFAIFANIILTNRSRLTRRKASSETGSAAGQVQRSGWETEEDGARGMAQFRKPEPTDVNLQMAIRAHAGTSHSPERRGEREVADYVASVQSFNDKLAAVADTEDRMVEAVAQAERFRGGYIKRQSDVWSSRSRMMSTMITGPANFPVRRQEKIWSAFEKKAKEFYHWQDRALAAAIKAIKAVGYVPPPKPEGAKTGTEEIQIGEVTIVVNHDIERVQIVFDGKPAPEVIAELKGAAWNWSPRNSAWQRKITNNSLYSAKRIAETANATAV